MMSMNFYRHIKDNLVIRTEPLRFSKQCAMEYNALTTFQSPENPFTHYICDEKQKISTNFSIENRDNFTMNK